MTTLHQQRTLSAGGADELDARRSSVGKVAFASAIGATIEWYDFFLYGAAAGLVFDQLYFGNFSGTMALSCRSRRSPSDSSHGRSGR